MVGRRGKHASTTDPEYETRMKLAVNDYTNGTYKTVIAAARAHEVRQSELCRHNIMSGD